MMWLIFVPIIFVILVATWWISTSNGFEIKKAKIEEAASGIEVALTKRYDVLTKMLDVTKAYMKHEKEVIVETIKLRKGMTTEEMRNASDKMDELASKINVVAESYPVLQSSESFKILQNNIADTEEHLQAARRLYNANITAYNTDLVVFPKSIVANSKHLVKKELFVAEDRKKEDVQITF